MYIGLDTETQDGFCILIATPSVSREVGSWSECMDFLFERAEGPVTDYVDWNVLFDAQSIMKYLPCRCLNDLNLRGRSTYRAFRLQYVKRKRLTIWWKGLRVNMWDCYPYYDMSLDNAAKRQLGERKMRVPRWWYQDMRKALRESREKVHRYCRWDAGLTQRLWEKIEAQYWDLGVDAKGAHSPGSLALKMLSKSYKLQEVPKWVEKIFRQCYFGGRAEIFKRGRFPTAWKYDIHSAYPSVLSKLLNPAKCEVVPFVRFPDSRMERAAYGCYKVRVRVHPDTTIGPLPFRRGKSTLIFPSGIWTSWVDLYTLKSLFCAGIDLDVIEGVELFPVEAERLVPGIPELYRLRKENPALNIAIKKTLNSIYGKYAETTRFWRALANWTILPPGTRYFDGDWRLLDRIPTKHTSFVVASHVTGAIRAEVFRVMNLYPEKVVAVHTDGILSTSKIPIPTGPDLGEWGKAERCERMVVMGTGMYCYYQDGEYREATRGFRLSKRLRQILRLKEPFAIVEHQRALTLGETQGNGYRDLNLIVKREKMIKANMDAKRFWPRPLPSLSYLLTHQQDSETLVTAEDIK